MHGHVLLVILIAKKDIKAYINASELLGLSD
jgi:hypothetical protein